jgi:type VI secretion system protein ImpA
MSAVWNAEALLEPISAEQPCGQNLDDVPVLPGAQTAVLSEFDKLRLYGQPRSPEAPPEAQDTEGSRNEPEKQRPPIEWDRLRAEAIEGLQKTKDLRLLAYLGTALLRTDGLGAFLSTLTLASQWLETYWPQVYPLLDDGDAMARRSALNCFADPMAVVDRVWRLPIVASKHHGRFSYRDLEVAQGHVQPAKDEKKPDERAIREALKELPIEELTALEAGITAATGALTAMDARMRADGGPDVAPDFGPLSTILAKLNRLYRDQIASRSETAVVAGEAVPGSPAAAAAGQGFTGGAIQSRQDAVRALDAVAEFFRRSEPSSPIPMIVERAKRLVAKDFLEVLADIAPDAVMVARLAGGLRPEE